MTVFVTEKMYHFYFDIYNAYAHDDHMIMITCNLIIRNRDINYAPKDFLHHR